MTAALGLRNTSHPAHHHRSTLRLQLSISSGTKFNSVHFALVNAYGRPPAAESISLPPPDARAGRDKRLSFHHLA